ncbi:MAG TPA: SprT-like domain-containing protein [Candidatus Baltobacteraceae bacterium]|nr:SprT-like domain-containing protein [Candidatus Baltobacteraceae bacterium]
MRRARNRSGDYARQYERTVPSGAQIFLRIYTRLGCEGRPPHFVVEYHPYTDLTHTIRLREDTARVRISDVMRTAPRTVVEAVAGILLGRLYRRRTPEDLVEIYRRFSYARSTRRRILQQRQRRARRAEHRPSGEHHDLAPLFERLNRHYFEGALSRPRLGWSGRAWRSQLGCFDPALNQIVINRLLDRPGVPEYVVSYVLYHEMLHQKHPIRFERCRRESHSAEFRREEKRFADYHRAMKFLERFPAA